MKKNSKLRQFYDKSKESYKKFKELWSVPKYRALIKLSLYGLMFFMLFIMANIFNEVNVSDNNKNEKSFAEMLKNDNIKNAEIEYKIVINGIEYKIEGKIENNILSGYLETNETIKKIKMVDNIMYNVINENEVIAEELNNIFIKEYLIPYNVIEIIQNESSYIEKQEDIKTYTYNINQNNRNYEIKLTTNLQTITNIYIKDENIEYNLNIVFDKNE